MKREFPPLMLADMNHPAVKQAWVSEYPCLHPGDCYNCGGSGSINLQVALAGPFRSPVTTSELNCKSEVLNGEIKWWGVKTTAYECPVCHGGNTVKPATIPVVREMDKLVDNWEGRKDING